MFNNEVTYDGRWNTAENEKYLAKLERKYFPRSICSPHCPHSWAKEVWTLMEYLNDEFGIARNTETFEGFRIAKVTAYSFTLQPFVNLVKCSYQLFIGYRFAEEDSWERERYSDMSVVEKLRSISFHTLHPFSYNLRALKAQIINPILNKIFKPKITLSQLKEKCGYLTVYFDSPDYLKNHIEEKIRETELRLAIKGAYYPPEHFYFASRQWNCGTEFFPNEYKVEYKTAMDGSGITLVTCYEYRQAMCNVGLDLNEMFLRAEERKALENGKMV